MENIFQNLKTCKIIDQYYMYYNQNHQKKFNNYYSK